jgi:hypothetical protein
MKITEFILAVAMGVGSAAASYAGLNTDLNTEATEMNTLATRHGESKVADKISGQFSDFLGTDSKAVVAGLRNSTPIKLTRIVATPTNTTGVPQTNTPTTSKPTTTIINPPTGKMGFGNVFISLALAKQQLGQMGITQPTPEQLKTALVGGSISSAPGTTASNTKLQGILTMRSEHMGWGQIAQKSGFKLGPVVSGLKSANQANTSSQSGGLGRSGNEPKSGSETGIVSGTGKFHGNSGREISGKTGTGEGIVSASGRSYGNSYAYGKGIVTGSGHVAGGNSTVVSGGGPGNSSGHGHNK